jgi:hypothetical protein
VEQADSQGCQNQEPQSYTGRSIRPATTVPPTVLVTELDNGALILQGRPDGPRLYLNPADAIPLRFELARAFGSPADLTPSDDKGDAP